MSFPQTRLTLIRRLASGGNERDWEQFLADYWGPICGFAMRWGNLSATDAEDVASKTFEVFFSSDVLARWHDNRAARLRTLLCSIARNVISNQARVERGRKRIREELAEQAPANLAILSAESPEPTAAQVDTFYAAWVDDLLRNCVEELLLDLHRVGKGDYFRVLYGKVCEDLSTKQIADLLQINTTAVENYYKAAKKRLGELLETALRRQVERYCDEATLDDEFRVEWGQLSEFLHKCGGLEQAVRAGHQQLTGVQTSRKSASFQNTKSRLSARKLAE